MLIRQSRKEGGMGPKVGTSLKAKKNLLANCFF